MLAIPVAGGALAFADITISPATGAVFMSLSTIIVALNAQLLRGVDLRSSFRGTGDRFAAPEDRVPAESRAA